MLKDGVKVKDAELISTDVHECGERCASSTRAKWTPRKRDGLLISLHLKATMMKVSDPILFGHGVSVYLQDVFAKHGALLDSRWA